MWTVKGQDITMTEGDYGVELPIGIGGPTFVSSDKVLLTIKKEKDGDAVLEKTFTNISGNTVNLTLTEANTALLPAGSYLYSLDWYQDDSFMCNIIPSAEFKVVEKI